MSDRVEITGAELEDVVGGALRWAGGMVWNKANPTVRYGYDNYEACLQWLRANWGGQVQDDAALQALLNAGLIHRL